MLDAREYPQGSLDERRAMADLLQTFGYRADAEKDRAEMPLSAEGVLILDLRTLLNRLLV